MIPVRSDCHNFVIIILFLIHQRKDGKVTRKLKQVREQNMSLKKTRTDVVRQGVLLEVAYLSVSTNHFILPLTAKSHLDSLESHFQKVRKDNRK